MKILIGMCTGGQVQAQTIVSLISNLDNIKQDGNISYRVSIQIGGNKSLNMNRLVRETLNNGYDYLMSIDNDMVFPADGVRRLLDNDKDIVGGNYAVRGNSVEGHPLRAVIKMADDKGNKVSVPVANLPKQLFRCHSLGNGFTLYKSRVFKELKAPWFEDFEDEGGNWSGEDVLFHERATQAGFEVWCNPKIELGHIGVYDYRLK